MPNASDPQKKSEGSILERVLSSQHAQALEGFVPTESFVLLIKGLSEKEQDVIRRRFGLHGKEPETLEEIGNRYRVTRERIRQIENTAIQKIRTMKEYRETIAPIERLLLSILNAHGGVMEEQTFFQETLSHAGNTPEQQRALAFILSELLRHRFERKLEDQDFRTCWKLKAQSLDLATQAQSTLVSLCTAAHTPLSRSDMLIRFRKHPLYAQHQAWFTDETIISYVGVSKRLDRNPFGEYGLVEWGTIVPKRMNDKINLILEKHGKPLHFTEIAQRINEAGFDERTAYPPTVHNELILNRQYVLVGRGIYALQHWGYKPGVVSEVLVDILKREKRAMSRDELLREVMKQRIVKKNTVLLALTNKKLFSRIPSGAYELVTSS